MTARMHPLFVELFIDPPGDQEDSEETRRVRRARARLVRKPQAVRVRSAGPSRRRVAVLPEPTHLLGIHGAHRVR